ncbi:MAG: RsbRD N-terminal domain-containing protein [Desulfomicrobium sp.]|jgi:hypothetical protein|nr:RsbRD N-terminal domain-containing protein [Desulfomicrobium sp.]NLV95918.1 hypothetical protein [Desulfovibrionales bacterium]
MKLENFFADHHKYLCSQWTEAIIKTYPEEGGKFFSSTSSQFSNPVGHTFRSNIERIVLAVAKGTDVAACTQDLDEILRIRAVQGFSPAVALGFIPALRNIVSQHIIEKCPAETHVALLGDLNILVDQLVLLGFDLYMQCRELLWRQKANQLYSRTHKLLERANLLQGEEAAE